MLALYRLHEKKSFDISKDIFPSNKIIKYVEIEKKHYLEGKQALWIFQ